MKNRIRLFVALVLATGLLGGCAASPRVPSSQPEVNPVLSGTSGAAHFDDGYVQIGSGPKTVDLFVDPICPYCKLFEQTSGELLLADADSGKIALRVHPLAILNRLSSGTDYSTRAAAMFVAVAAESPDKAGQYLHELYEQQPAENTPGLTNDQLRGIVSSVGASPISDDDLTQYETWVDTHTQLAVNGPLDATSQITSVTQVPTVLVNGSVFPGNSNESDAFATFYNAR